MSESILAQLTRRVDKIEPELLKTTWPPMTYMLIPSVLSAADVLIRDLMRAASRSDDEELVHQLERLTLLRRNFRRITK